MSGFVFHFVVALIYLIPLWILLRYVVRKIKEKKYIRATIFFVIGFPMIAILKTIITSISRIVLNT